LDITVDNRIITDRAMNSLSKLSKLQSIKIWCYEDIVEVEEIADILPLIKDIGLLNGWFSTDHNCGPSNQLYIDRFRRP
jgi:hypothetical protein